MGLLIDNEATFDVIVKYIEDGEKLIFYEKEDKIPEGKIVGEETFAFKRVSWSDFKLMMSESIIVSGGAISLNPYVFMDIKFKLLLKKWSLKDKNGKPLELNIKNIDNLNPQLCEYLNKKLDLALGTPIEHKVEVKIEAKPI
jgi:hypothetical protein